jgi:hypothetical protein
MIGGLLRFAPGRRGAPRPRARGLRTAVEGCVVVVMLCVADELDTRPAQIGGSRWSSQAGIATSSAMRRDTSAVAGGIGER